VRQGKKTTHERPAVPSRNGKLAGSARDRTKSGVRGCDRHEPSQAGGGTKEADSRVGSRCSNYRVPTGSARVRSARGRAMRSALEISPEVPIARKVSAGILTAMRQVAERNVPPAGGVWVSPPTEASSRPGFRPGRRGGRREGSLAG
jgi:hypothetical protein